MPARQLVGKAAKFTQNAERNAEIGSRERADQHRRSHPCAPTTPPISSLLLSVWLWAVSLLCAMHLSCLWGHTIPVVINRLETKVYADASRLKMQVGVVGHGGHPEDTGIVPHVHVCEAKDVCRSHFSRGLYIRGRARRTHQIVPYETRPDIPTATAALRAATQPNARRHRRRARERGEMRRGAPQSWSTPPVVACSASCLLPLIARPPHTLCLGGSLNILLAAPECMVKGR